MRVTLGTRALVILTPCTPLISFEDKLGSHVAEIILGYTSK